MAMGAMAYQKRETETARASGLGLMSLDVDRCRKKKERGNYMNYRQHVARNLAAALE